MNSQSNAVMLERVVEILRSTDSRWAEPMRDLARQISLMRECDTCGGLFEILGDTCHACDARESAADKANDAHNQNEWALSRGGR